MIEYGMPATEICVVASTGAVHDAHPSRLHRRRATCMCPPALAATRACSYLKSCDGAWFGQSSRRDTVSVLPHAAAATRAAPLRQSASGAC
eukprot:364779-Chlamydomonas_euryale.AAC.26